MKLAFIWNIITILEIVELVHLKQRSEFMTWKLGIKQNLLTEILT